jgi:tRNA A-37 threonylcarbamoyl transferase component Bud32
MVHLHLESVVHRDLAARNILLTASFDVKGIYLKKREFQ